MPDLQHLHLWNRGAQFTFHPCADITCEQCVEAAVPQVDHDRVLVRLEFVAHPITSRMQHGEDERVDGDRVTSTSDAPLDPA